MLSSSQRNYVRLDQTTATPYNARRSFWNLLAGFLLLSLPLASAGNGYSYGNYQNDDGATDDFYGDDSYSNNQMDDAYLKEQKQFQYHDDDAFHWDENVGFDNVSVMPLSCIN